MTGSDESLAGMLARVRASFDRQGMMSTLGVEVSAVERGKVWMSLGHDERFTQQHGFMHAGAVASATCFRHSPIAAVTACQAALNCWRGSFG